MKNYYIVIILLFTLALSACRGDQQNKLIGVWEQIPFTEPDSIHTYWQFFAGDALFIYTIDEAMKDTTKFLKFAYNVDGSTFTVLTGQDDPPYSSAAPDARGEYWVDELSNSNLKMTKRKHPDGTTDAVYMRIELVKR